MHTDKRKLQNPLTKVPLLTFYLNNGKPLTTLEQLTSKVTRDFVGTRRHQSHQSLFTHPTNSSLPVVNHLHDRTLGESNSKRKHRSQSLTKEEILRGNTEVKFSLKRSLGAKLPKSTPLYRQPQESRLPLPPYPNLNQK